MVFIWVSRDVRVARRALRNRVQALKSEIAGSTSAPTPVQTERLHTLTTDLRKTVDQLNTLIGERLPAFSRLLEENKLPPLPGDLPNLLPTITSQSAINRRQR